MSAIYILWLRELKRYVRSRAQIVASLGQPLLYLLALGFGLGPVFQRAGYGSYIQLLAPGVIGMSVLFSSIFSGLGLLWDRQFGFLKETLVAPVPRLQIMIGRTFGGATVAVIQGTLVLIISLIAGFRPANWLLVPVAFAFMIADRSCVCGARRRHRIEHSGHAGFSAHHEFPGHAHLLPVRRVVPARRAWDSSHYHHAARSTFLRDRRHSLRALQSTQFQPAFAVSTSAIVLGRRWKRFAGHWRVAIF